MGILNMQISERDWRKLTSQPTLRKTPRGGRMMAMTRSTNVAVLSAIAGRSTPNTGEGDAKGERGWEETRRRGVSGEQFAKFRGTQKPNPIAQSAWQFLAS